MKVQDQYADLHPSGFDYLLTAIASVLTCYSAGMSVANETVGWIFVILSLLGIWISFAVMRTIRGSSFVEWNGFIYAGGVLAAFFSSRYLVTLLPENPFTAQIFVCGLLLWMLVFGSFLVWSDQTLLFQAVPSIAIFGLVGCYDTYRDAVWMFFGFLLCFATTLARVHGRTMLRQAKESGYSQTGDRMDRSATELERMRSGPWKWVAGPQWALGSAFVVILFSFVGAPIIRQSVQGVAGAVRVTAPVSSRFSSSAISGGTDPSTYRVGAGPNQLSNLPSFRATLDVPRYMRTGIYQAYTPAGWQAQASQPVGDKTNIVLGRSAGRSAIRSIVAPQTIEFQIEPLTSRLSSIPIPGEIQSISPDENTTIRQDATLTIIQTGQTNVFRGKSIVSANSELPRDAMHSLVSGQESLVSTTNIPASVYDLTNRVIQGADTDFERARLIKQYIEQNVKYNLNAGETPTGRDAVEYFLFDSKEGYCDLFASAMALMARSAGIPSRMVVGFYPISNDRDADGRFVVKESDRHAWAELFFEGHGWMVFDATEGAEEVPGGELGSSNLSDLAKSELLRKALEIGIGLLALTFIFLTVRNFVGGAKAKPLKTDLDKEYLRFVDVLAKASGRPRNFDQTPSEYAAQVSEQLPSHREMITNVSRRFERLFYSPDLATKEDVSQLRTMIRDIRTAIGKGSQRVAS